jgi:hypothetical protein
MAMASFGFMENIQLEKAKECALRALELDPHNSWAQHNLAHAFLGENDHANAKLALLGKQADWKGRFIYTHNFWHLSVIHLVDNETDEAIRILREELYGRWNHIINHINTIMLLMYLNHFGVDVMPLINEEVRQKAETQRFWGQDGIFDLCAVWLLSKVGSPLVENLVAVRNDAPWVAACDALRTLVTGDKELARSKMVESPMSLLYLGGSNEQRKSFTDITDVTDPMIGIAPKVSSN